MVLRVSVLISAGMNARMKLGTLHAYSKAMRFLSIILECNRMDLRTDVECPQDRIPCWSEGKKPSKHLAHNWRLHVFHCLLHCAQCPHGFTFSYVFFLSWRWAAGLMHRARTDVRILLLHPLRSSHPQYHVRCLFANRARNRTKAQ
jgi:hypothetical protein